MTVLGQLRLSFWLSALGAITLYAFFLTLASISPAEVIGLTLVVANLVMLVTLRNLRVAKELADPGGDPHLRTARNKVRERRGF